MTTCATVTSVRYPEWIQSPGGRAAEPEYWVRRPYISLSGPSAATISERLLMHGDALTLSCKGLGEIGVQIRLSGQTQQFTETNLKTIATVIQTYAGAVEAAIRAASFVQDEELRRDCAQNSAKAFSLLQRCAVATGIDIQIDHPQP